MKASFFSNFGYDKPAVTLFTFDISDFYSSGQEWDWAQIEAMSIFQMQNHCASWSAGLAVPSKYVALFIFPE